MAEEVTALLSEIRDLLGRIDRKLDGIVDRFRPSPDPSVASSAGDDIEALSTEEVIRRIEVEKEGGRCYDVLDLRRELVRRLDEEERWELDRALARWFTRHFHQSLRAGHAAVVVGAIERAVQEIGPIPEMQHLADSLPAVLRSVGLYQQVQEERLDD